MRGGGVENKENKETGDEDLLKLLMIGPSTSRVNQAAGNTRNEQLVVYLELNDRVQILLLGFKHSVEFLGLRNRTREAIENEPA